MIVYDLNELKKIYDLESYGKIGMWGFHAKLHDGHRQCARITKEKTDYNICFHWQNFGEGVRLLTGNNVDPDNPIDDKVIEEALKYSNVVMIFKDNYHPYLEHYKTIKEVLDRDFPEQLLIDTGIRSSINLYGSLIYAVAIRVLLHKIYNIKIDYQASCGRERWKMVGYVEWCFDEFGLVHDLLEPVTDRLGNCLSGMKNRIPSEITNRINKKLILSEFNSKEDLEEHIKDIKGLKIDYFYKEYGWIQAKFYFEESPNEWWWVEGIKY